MKKIYLNRYPTNSPNEVGNAAHGHTDLWIRLQMRPSFNSLTSDTFKTETRLMNVLGNPLYNISNAILMKLT